MQLRHQRRGAFALCLLASLAAPAALASTPAARFAIILPQAATARFDCAGQSCPTPELTPAAGIVADGAAAALIVAETATAPSSVSITTTNEATLIPYDPNYRSYKPAAGSTSLTVSGSQIVEYQPGVYVVAIEQAPDILQHGADGNLPDYSQPVVTQVMPKGYATETLQLQLYPPPILFVHGLWGDAASLAKVSAALAKQAPWQGLPAAFLTRFSYQNDAAFDSATIEQTVSNQLNTILQTLTSDQIAMGRVDVVAHSMGGLVARAVSGLSGYDGPASRTLGAFHQIVTINTPEAGSLLANFLVDNQAVTFSPNAGLIAKQVKAAACPNATTVAACFAAAGENLAPPGQPITAGAVYSLEPNSPNIAALPSANIANATWRASSSTVSQNSNLMFGTNALVFELDSLIAATCPGASYCPNASSKIPVVGSILRSNSNDAIVTLASQTAGCSGPCQSATYPKLAHTRPADAGAFANFVLSFKNVLESASVDGFVACNLANTGCTGGTLAVADADDEAAEPPGQTVPPHQIGAIWVVPSAATMGTEVRIVLKVPFGSVRSVYVRQDDGRGGHQGLPASLSPDAAGNTVASVPALLMGSVDYTLNASLAEGAFAVRRATLQVATPSQPPLAFWADANLPQNGPAMPLILHVGQHGALDPAVVLAAAPDVTVRLRHDVTFRAIQDAAHPVVALQPDGRFVAEREGQATIEASFAGFTASLQVRVDQSAMLMIQTP
jgi:pimeloyl-ACP methyl ester carboxylesterase